ISPFRKRALIASDRRPVTFSYGYRYRYFESISRHSARRSLSGSMTYLKQGTVRRAISDLRRPLTLLLSDHHMATESYRERTARTVPGRQRELLRLGRGRRRRDEVARTALEAHPPGHGGHRPADRARLLRLQVCPPAIVGQVARQQLRPVPPQDLQEVL